MKKKILISCLLFLFFSFFVSVALAINFFKEYQPHINYLLGVQKPITYLLLLGNDTEARANGGFAGSYAKITLSNQDKICFLKSEICNLRSEISFHDIYVPNGQLSGYVKPPEPIQQAFGHGTWELANADWDPNFPTAATSLRWFLEKGKEVNPDILAILNLSTIKKVLDIIGPFSVSEYNANITPDNLYLFLQGKAEVNFFPGSTQKEVALHAVGTALLKKFYNLPTFQKLKVANIIFQDLQRGNLVLNSTNPVFQTFLENKNFAGIYKPYSFDHYGLIEMNLGANKANAYVTRQTTHQVVSENNQTKHTVSINFQNSSEEANPNPPLHYGGHYIAYLRIYLPKNASDILVNHTEIATGAAVLAIDVLYNQLPRIEKDLFTEIGFWHITLAGNTSQINLSYTLPPIEPEDYTLTILKQNGFPVSPQKLSLFGQSLPTDLRSNFNYSK